jgi:hypothetical protein
MRGHNRVKHIFICFNGKIFKKLFKTPLSQKKFKFTYCYDPVCYINRTVWNMLLFTKTCVTFVSEYLIFMMMQYLFVCNIIIIISYKRMKLLEFVEGCRKCTYYKRDWRGELTDIQHFDLMWLITGNCITVIHYFDCEQWIAGRYYYFLRTTHMWVIVRFFVLTDYYGS